MPEALAISERVSQQLRRYVQSNVPFGDRLTVAQVLNIYRWRGAIDVAEKAYDVWRLLRLVNPVTAATNEARERLSKALLGWGREHVTRRLAEHYVEEVGRAAIDLYGGRLRVALDPPLQSADVEATAGAAETASQASVLVIGCTLGERAALAGLIARAEKAETERWLASPGTTSRPAVYDVRSTYDLAATEPDLLCREVDAADIVILLSGREGPTSQDRAALAIVSGHFSRNPSLLAPVLLPVVIERRGRIENGAKFDDSVAPLSACYGGAVAPTVDAGCLDTGGDGAALRSALHRALPLARRVATLRQIESLKRRSRWKDAGWQATAAAGSLARALWKRRGEAADRHRRE